MAERTFYVVAVLVGTATCSTLLNHLQYQEHCFRQDFDAMFWQKKATRNGIAEKFNHFNITQKKFGSCQYLLNMADLGNFCLRGGYTAGKKQRLPKYVTVDSKWQVASSILSLILIYEWYFPVDLYVKMTIAEFSCYTLYKGIQRKYYLPSAKWANFVRSENERLHFIAMFLSWFTCSWMSISVTTNTIRKERISFVPLVVCFDILMVLATLWMMHFFEGEDFFCPLKQEYNKIMALTQVHSDKEPILRTKHERKGFRNKCLPLMSRKSHKIQFVSKPQTSINRSRHLEMETEKESFPVSKSNVENKRNWQNKADDTREVENVTETSSSDTVRPKITKTTIKSTDESVNSHQFQFSHSPEYVTNMTNSISKNEQKDPRSYTFRFPLRRDRSVSEDDDSESVVPQNFGNGKTVGSVYFNKSCLITPLQEDDNVFMESSDVKNQISGIDRQSPRSFQAFLDELSNGRVFETSKQMEFEWMRLQTFKNDFPNTCSRLRLAQSGFYATGNEDEVKCFNCGRCHKNWRESDNPHIMHSAISPGCSMVLGTCDIMNKPIQTNTHIRLQEILTQGSYGNFVGQADSSYTMNSTPRGIAVIINNEIFHHQESGQANEYANCERHLDMRQGTHIDGAKLCGLWQYLEFEVQYHENATVKQMMKISQQAALLDHSECSCLVFCILTHGDCGRLFGTDGRSLTIDEITGHFLSGVCEHLAGKPKLFFIQACQGSADQTGYAIPTDANQVYTGVMVNNSAWHRIQESIPQEADFLLSYSTVPGYVSFRSQDYGSWYIQSLQKNLLNHHSEYDLITILTVVNAEVGTFENKDGEMIYKQMPTYMSTLRKRVYFS